MCLIIISFYSYFFFFNDTATTEIYTLSLHDALPITLPSASKNAGMVLSTSGALPMSAMARRSEEHTSDSSHSQISYAVFCLKKKKINVKSRYRNMKKYIGHSYVELLQ